MVIQFALQDLIFFSVCTLGIAAGILLLPILWNIKKVVGILRPLVETNQEFIKKTIRTMPGIFENVEQISSNVRETTDKLKISVPVILQEAECVTHAAKESVEIASAAIDNVSSGVIDTVAGLKKDTSEFTTYFHIIADVVQTIYRTLSSSK